MTKKILRIGIVVVCLSTAAVVQPASGLLLAYLAGWPLNAPWLALSIGLFVLTGVLWLPVVWLQLRMAAMAAAAREGTGVLAAAYWRYTRWWEALGYPAFIAMIAVFYLMVAKPSSWEQLLPF